MKAFASVCTNIHEMAFSNLTFFLVGQFDHTFVPYTAPGAFRTIPWTAEESSLGVGIMLRTTDGSSDSTARSHASRGCCFKHLPP